MVEQKQFKDKDTEKVWNRVFVKKWSKELQKRTWEEIQSIPIGKMTTLFAFANDWNKLRETFGTDLEPLRGKRKGQHSIRVNGQWRICFIWELGKVYEVELVDYHDGKK